ncbi:hypothetical protein QBC40DRAFT_2266 [Triangularia verruculosa]|uniref:Uncharacterized protein n=1 Tax=Triangularia verruculosa TaxID=2587418 RepID=A0AAN6XSK0_9PEZI|nr:hypothetical protein QBC40DRAFT_2266 [Triangularia verruculosa]
MDSDALARRETDGRRGTDVRRGTDGDHSERVADPDFEIRIYALRHNIIDTLASYLITRDAVTHGMHSEESGSNVRNQNTDIFSGRTSSVRKPYIRIIAAHDQVQVPLTFARNMLHYALNKAWVRLMRSAFYLVYTLTLDLSLRLMTTTPAPALTITITTLLATATAYTAYRTTLYYVLRSKSQGVDQIKARLNKESAYYKARNPDPDPDPSSFQQSWLLAPDDLSKLGAKVGEWREEDDDERKQPTSSQRPNATAMSLSDTAGWAWAEWYVGRLCADREKDGSGRKGWIILLKGSTPFSQRGISIHCNKAKHPIHSFTYVRTP